MIIDTWHVACIPKQKSFIVAPARPKHRPHRSSPQSACTTSHDRTRERQGAQPLSNTLAKRAIRGCAFCPTRREELRGWRTRMVCSSCGRTNDESPKWMCNKVAPKATLLACHSVVAPRSACSSSAFRRASWSISW